MVEMLAEMKQGWSVVASTKLPTWPHLKFMFLTERLCTQKESIQTRGEYVGPHLMLLKAVDSQHVASLPLNKCVVD